MIDIHHAELLHSASSFHAPFIEPAETAREIAAAMTEKGATGDLAAVCAM